MKEAFRFRFCLFRKVLPVLSCHIEDSLRSPARGEEGVGVIGVEELETSVAASTAGPLPADVIEAIESA